jgi:stress-induced morphogen
MVTKEQIETRVKEVLPSAEVSAMDLTGGGDHWRLVVSAKEFAGKTLVEQHQMIYAALGDWMRQEIHALALDTKATPG